MQEEKIESIIVSFNCLDLLSITLPRNLSELDHIIIVTKPEDKETINYCESFGIDKITVVTTDAFTYNQAIFNKGLAINVGFRFLKYFDWILLKDTDVLLHREFKKDFSNLEKNKNCMYGSRRINLDTKKDFDDLESGIKKESDFICYRGFCYGFEQIINYNSETFQRLLKNNKGLSNLPYPYWMKEAREIDWLFAREFDNGTMVYDPPLGKFPECHLEKHNDYATGLLRELPWKCIHLGMPGKNHEKRETSKFE